MCAGRVKKACERRNVRRRARARETVGWNRSSTCRSDARISRRYVVSRAMGCPSARQPRSVATRFADLSKGMEANRFFALILLEDATFSRARLHPIPAGYVGLQTAARLVRCGKLCISKGGSGTKNLAARRVHAPSRTHKRRADRNEGDLAASRRARKWKEHVIFTFIWDRPGSPRSRYPRSRFAPPQIESHRRL